jgi:hypothetical protein
MRFDYFDALKPINRNQGPALRCFFFGELKWERYWGPRAKGQRSAAIMLGAAAGRKRRPGLHTRVAMSSFAHTARVRKILGQSHGRGRKNPGEEHHHQRARDQALHEMFQTDGPTPFLHTP